MSEPKVLTFDVVGTLIDFERGMLNYLRSACGPAMAALDDDTVLASYRTARARDGSGRFPDDLARVYREIAPELGLPQDEAIGTGFAQSIKDWPAFPDSVAALQRLKRRFTLVAMTNAQRWALDHMARTLGDPFDDSVTVDEALCDKPDPRFFAFARGRLSRDGHGLHDILHVAQSQYHDIGVAKRLGYTVCWIERRRGMKGSGGTLESAHTTPDYHFGTLAELADACDAGAIAIRR
ncbi:MAG TPA: HAD-IA family hydrolase [Acetobacteraceae bacterium]|nr:HAD-IA family hydrolase [Acetobacteraceae bacterium]